MCVVCCFPLFFFFINYEKHFCVSASPPAQDLLQWVESPQHVRVSVREQRVGQRGWGRGGQARREGGRRTAQHGGTHPHPSTQFHQLALAHHQQQRWADVKLTCDGVFRSAAHLILWFLPHALLQKNILSRQHFPWWNIADQIKRLTRQWKLLTSSCCKRHHS